LGNEWNNQSREELVGGGVDDDRPEATNGCKHRQEHANYDAKLQVMSKAPHLFISIVYQRFSQITCMNNNASSIHSILEVLKEEKKYCEIMTYPVDEP
jgi:hypothetical protein